MEFEAFPPSDSLRDAATTADTTKDRLLDAAELLFGEHGFRGTSMRAVTQSAGVSVSAANYHFGSKLELYRATLHRCLDSVNVQRIAAIEEVVRAAGPEVPALEDILGAFLEPLILSPPGKRAQYRGVVARIYTDPPELIAEMKQELFGPLMTTAVDASRRALPGYSREEVTLAFQIAIGVMLHFLSGQIESAAGLRSRHHSDEELIERLPASCAAGMRAYLENPPSRASE